MRKLSINSKGSSVSEHDSTPSSPSSSTEDIPGAVQGNSEPRSESPISFSLSRVRHMFRIGYDLWQNFIINHFIMWLMAL